jgi:hypothetical protein
MSIVVEYRNPEGIIMARTHQYVRGNRRQASGLGAPTTLNDGGRFLVRRHKDDERCEDCDAWRPRAAETATRLPAHIRPERLR